MSNVSKGQIQLPDEFKPGEPIRAGEMDKLRQAIAFALKDMIGGGRGITVSQSAGKYLISARKQRGGTSKSFPLQPVKSGADKVKFRWGTVRGIGPQIGGEPITTDLNDEANPEITVDAAGVIYVKVDLAPDTYEATNPVLAFVAGDESDIPEDIPRESAHAPLVSVAWDTENEAITGLSPAHKGSIDVASCAGVTNYWDLG